MCALAVAAVAVTAPSAYGASGPTYLGFEGPAAGTTAPNLYPGSGVTFSVVQNSAECLDTPVVQTAQDAKTPPHQFYMPCNPTMTLRFSTPQAFVALWARSTSTAQNPIAVRGLNALGQQVATQDIAANAGWVAATLTVPTATISTVTIAGFGVVDLDDLAFSTQGPSPTAPCPSSRRPSRVPRPRRSSSWATGAAPGGSARWTAPRTPSAPPRAPARSATATWPRGRTCSARARSTGTATSIRRPPHTAGGST